MIRRTVLGFVAAVLVASCGVDVGDVRVGPFPACDGATPELLLLMAQAVPTASHVPCVDQIPEGWVLDEADIEAGWVGLEFDGPDLEVHVTLSASCNGNRMSAEAADVRSDMPFDGGCVVVESPARPAAAEMVERVSLIGRETLRSLRDVEL